MSQSSEDSQHIPSNEVPKPGLGTLSTELVLNIYNALEDTNERKTAQDRNALRAVNRRLNEIMEDQGHALGRHQTTMKVSVNAATKLHDRLYPKEGLSNHFAGARRHLRVTAAEQIEIFGPVLDLLPPTIQSGIVEDIVGPNSKLAAENQAGATCVMCGFLDKLHNKDDAKRIVDNAVFHFTKEGDQHAPGRQEGAHGVVLATENLSDEQEELVDHAIEKRPELKTLFAAAIVAKDPQRLERPGIVPLVVGEVAEMDRFDQWRTLGALLEHLDKFQEEHRAELVEEAVLILEEFPDVLEEMLDQDVEELNDSASSLFTQVAKMKASFSQDQLERIALVSSSSDAADHLWTQAKKAAILWRRNESTKSAGISAQAPKSRADPASIAQSFETVTDWQALSPNASTFLPNRYRKTGAEIAQNIARQVEVSRAEVKATKREFDDRSRGGSSHSI